MPINYKPADGWAADFIPFYWQGAYHLFYLKDYRDVPQHGEGTPWFHLETRDFVHFIEHGECLPRSAVDEQDLYVFTGSVLHAAGQFHIFYTGHNPHLRAAGKPEQALMHAVSDDLIHWQKQPADTFYAPSGEYEPHDWRDPFVFWNAEANQYWMLLAARLKTGPSRRRGCTALCTSTDLRHWQVQAPLYAPGLYYTHECPDLFHMDGWWYLLFSEFSEATLTRYRMARSLAGPWLTPAVDSLDGRAFYAAKTAASESQRFLFGWNPTRVGDSDSGNWQWGGSLAVHELIQRPDGSLAARLPHSVRAAFHAPQPVAITQNIRAADAALPTLRLTAPDHYSCVTFGGLPRRACLEASVLFQSPTHSLGLLLNFTPDLESGYSVRLEPLRSRLVFDAWPRPGDQPFLTGLERPLDFSPGEPLQLQVYLDETLVEIYVNQQVALSARMYNNPGGEWGVFVSEGSAEFSQISLLTRD